MKNPFHYEVDKATIAFSLPDDYVWDCSVIEEDGKYHMFSSHWPYKFGFGANWLFNSEIIHSVADKPEGPFVFHDVVLPRRGRQYFDGMNTHNTCIKKHNGKFYLYYMGTTYDGFIPDENHRPDDDYVNSTWANKRIGIAVSDSINGPWKRHDAPLLEPRPDKWDAQATTNPSVIIMPSGKTYMIYKSRKDVGQTLKLGIAVADNPEGPFERLMDNPILETGDPDKHMEDPTIWYDEARKKFCMICKDDVKCGGYGFTGEWGSGFYAESDDCIHFVVPDDPKVYGRTVKGEDGELRTQCNLERPSVLFDKNGKPVCIYCASGNGKHPYAFEGRTYIMCLMLKEKENA